MKIVLALTILLLAVMAFQHKKHPAPAASVQHSSVAPASPWPGAPDAPAVSITSEQMEQIEKLGLGDFSKGTQLTSDQKHQLEELGISPDQLKVEMHSPLLAMQKNAAKKKDTYLKAVAKASSLKAYLWSHKKNVPQYASTFLILIFLSVFALWYFQAREALKSVSGLLFGVSQLTLILMGFASLWVLYAFKKNLWTYANFLPLWLSLGLLAGANLAQRFEDESHPFLKTLLKDAVPLALQVLALHIGITQFLK